MQCGNFKPKCFYCVIRGEKHLWPRNGNIFSGYLVLLPEILENVFIKKSFSFWYFLIWYVTSVRVRILLPSSFLVAFLAPQASFSGVHRRWKRQGKHPHISRVTFARHLTHSVRTLRHIEAGVAVSLDASVWSRIYRSQIGSCWAVARMPLDLFRFILGDFHLWSLQIFFQLTANNDAFTSFHLSPLQTRSTHMQTSHMQTIFSTTRAAALGFTQQRVVWRSVSIRNIPNNLCQIRAFNCCSSLRLGVGAFPLPKLFGFEHLKALLSNFQGTFYNIQFVTLEIPSKPRGMKWGLRLDFLSL